MTCKAKIIFFEILKKASKKGIFWCFLKLFLEFQKKWIFSMILALHVIILAYIDYKRINMMSNDIVKPRAHKNNHWRALQVLSKISIFEPFFSLSKWIFWFLSLSVSHIRAQGSALHQKVFENIPCFRRVKIGQIDNILEPFEIWFLNGKFGNNPGENDSAL